MMGSSWLVGIEMLGMKAIFDAGYPLPGKVSCPRQVVQTAGCLLSQAIRPCQSLFLEALRAILDPARGQKFGERAFYPVFLVIFMVLHECEDTNKDRERYARQNFKIVSKEPIPFCSLPHLLQINRDAKTLTTGLCFENVKEKFSMPDYIKDLHESVRRLVHYWLIFADNLGVKFSTKQTLEASLGFLDKAKRDLVVSSYDDIVNKTCGFKPPPPSVAFFEPARAGKPCLFLDCRLTMPQKLQLPRSAPRPPPGSRTCASSRTCLASRGVRTLSTRGGELSCMGQFWHLHSFLFAPCFLFASAPVCC